MSRLPLVNGATAGPDVRAPDAAALAAVLARAEGVVARMQPALRRLLGRDAVSAAAAAAVPSGGISAGQQQQQQQQPPGGVAATAAHARELIDLACDGVQRLGAAKARLERLADAALYAASLQAQLAQLREAAAGGGGGGGLP